MLRRIQLGSPRRTARESGATSMQILAIFVPVLIAFMGFAIDIGRAYAARGELQAAANAMALAAAGRLIGTEQSTTDAARQAQLVVETGSGIASRYDFGRVAIGSSDGFLNSEIFESEYYDTLAAALASGGSTAGGGTAKYVRVRLRAEAPMLFFGFLPTGQDRKAAIEVDAVAGQSAPLCQACGIEPIAIQAPDATDTTHFGMTPGTLYTLGYSCTGPNNLGLLTGTTGRLNYLLLNRYNESATLYAEELQQAYRIGAGGLPPSTAPAQSCVTVLTDETIWVNAAPTPCQGQRAAPVSAFVCGLVTRLDPTVQTNCSTITEVDTMNGLYAQDSDITDVADYTAYTGNGRRLLTVPVVETLNAGGTMQAIGFRQFLLEPNQDSATINAADQNGRFRAMYIGAVAPVRQGRFDGCTLSAGPGKAVLHR